MHIFGEEEVLSIPFRVVIFFVAGCPFIAFVVCLLLCFFLHYERAVATHCGVLNWLPSLSAVVAYSPERYVWRFFIGASGAPRVALAIAFRNHLLNSGLWPLPYKRWFRWTCHFACALNICEIVSLALLTIISSIENHFLHVSFFNMFAVSSTLYMIASTWLFDLSGRRCSSKLGELSYQSKAVCCVAQFLSLLFALYFFYRHNRYCEPGVYTLFALAEYSLIFFNVLFHSTLYYDFRSRVFSLVTAAFSANYDLLPMHDYSEKRGT